MHPAAAFFAWLGIFLGFITVLTFIHEIGHFSVAKIRGVRVAEFSIGFGPAIFQKKKGETTYSLRWIPFGGYVSVLSDESIEEIERLKQEIMTPEEREKLQKKLYGLSLDEDYTNSITINQKSYLTKMLFILGGVTMNFMFGWMALFSIYMISGVRTQTDTPMVAAQILDDTGAPTDGLTYGFKMTEYEVIEAGNPTGETGTGMEDFWTSFEEVVDTGSETTDFSVTFEISEPKGIEATGLVQYYKPGGQFYTSFTWTDDGEDFVVFTEFTLNEMYEAVEFNYLDSGWEALGQAFIDAWILIGYMFVLLFDILTLGFVVPHDDWNKVYLGAEQYQVQVQQWVGLLANLSMMLVAFNIIPLPPLDGWKAVEFTYEELTKKKVSKDTLLLLQKFGYAFIAVILIFQFFFLI